MFISIVGGNETNRIDKSCEWTKSTTGLGPRRVLKVANFDMNVFTESKVK